MRLNVSLLNGLFILNSPSGVRKMVVDFYEGDKVASTMVSEDEEDDRDNVVPL